MAKPMLPAWVRTAAKTAGGRGPWSALAALAVVGLALSSRSAYGQLPSIDDAAAREFSTFRPGGPIPIEDRIGREASIFRREQPAILSDGHSREFVAFRAASVATLEDASSREFSIYRDRPPVVPVDADSREFVGFRPEVLPVLNDAFAREFCVYNDSVRVAIDDASSREFTVHRPGPIVEQVDSQSREWGIWCLTPAGAPDREPPPPVLTLLPPRPNPFDRSCRITFGLPRATTVSLEVFDAAGRRVDRILCGERLAAGWHTEGIDGTSWKAGVYFYRLQTAEDGRRSGKLILGR